MQENYHNFKQLPKVERLSTLRKTKTIILFFCNEYIFVSLKTDATSKKSGSPVDPASLVLSSTATLLVEDGITLLT